MQKRPLLSPCFFLLGIFFLTPLYAAHEYRVSKGDNLYRIGQKFGVPYQKIMAANGLKKTVIHPNQLLIIPGGAANTPPARTASSTPSVAATPRPIEPVAGQIPSFEALRREIEAPDRPAHRDPVDLSRVKPPQPPQDFSPKDPRQPYVTARKLPTLPPLGEDSTSTKEDPLGLGYNPQAQPKSIRPHRPLSQPKPAPKKVSPPAIAKAIPKPQPTPRSTYTPAPTKTIRVPAYQDPTPKAKPSPSRPFAQFAQIFSGTREVPANAKSPSRSTVRQREVIRYPQPSFGAKSTTTQYISSRTYVVQPGDSVWKISRKFGISPLKLRRHNKIMLSRIHPGMRLVIP